MNGSWEAMILFVCGLFRGEYYCPKWEMGSEGQTSEEPVDCATWWRVGSRWRAMQRESGEAKRH